MTLCLEVAALGVMDSLLPLTPRLKQLEPVLDAVVAAAEITARAARRKYRAIGRRGAYAALRPGPATPLWNELARACAQNLGRRGDKARLARLIGVPRQRLHLLLVARTACADAERTLRLLAWLQARKKGRDPL